jgi:hypothetical protein
MAGLVPSGTWNWFYGLSPSLCWLPESLGILTPLSASVFMWLSPMSLPSSLLIKISHWEWKCGSSSRVLAVQAWSPEFKPQSHQKKKKSLELGLFLGWYHIHLITSIKKQFPGIGIVVCAYNPSCAGSRGRRMVGWNHDQKWDSIWKIN